MTRHRSRSGPGVTSGRPTRTSVSPPAQECGSAIKPSRRALGGRRSWHKDIADSGGPYARCPQRGGILRRKRLAGCHAARPISLDNRLKRRLRGLHRREVIRSQIRRRGRAPTTLFRQAASRASQDTDVLDSETHAPILAAMRERLVDQSLAKLRVAKVLEKAGTSRGQLRLGSARCAHRRLCPRIASPVPTITINLYM